jgi:uncharacterized SAM-binding protein YcdF (DUF218 family)
MKAPRIFRSPMMLRLGQLMGAAAVIWLAGFLWFLATLPQPGQAEAGTGVDGIVVLTGGPGRVQAGLDSLASGKGRRLLISGVNPELASKTIMNAIAGDQAPVCCIDLGRKARDTHGNAIEAAEWAKHHDFRSLLVITADYHLPRALIEFAGIMKDVKLVAGAVDSHASYLSMAAEFNKYLFSVIRDRVDFTETKD